MTEERLAVLAMVTALLPVLKVGRVPEDEEPDTLLVGSAGIFWGRVVGTPDMPAAGRLSPILTACRAMPELVAEVRRLRGLMSVGCVTATLDGTDEHEPLPPAE